MAEFIHSTAEKGNISVKGDWTIANLQEILHEIDSLPGKKETGIAASIEAMDTAGAMALRDLSRKLDQSNPEGAAITGLDEKQQALLTLIVPKEEEKETPPSQPPPGPLIDGISTLGKNTLDAWQTILDLTAFIGETVIELGRTIRNPRQFRLASVVRHIRETGINAIPIVSLIAFLISIVLAYQGAGQLKRFGAEIFTINMVAVSVLREMGVLLTAIMIAGRSGSAFTAEIGVMKVNEEIDAMRIMGVEPFEILVLPRVIALMISLPLLAFIANIMGLLGGGIISATLLNISPEQYIGRLHNVVTLSDFWVGMIKAPVFAFFIAVVACMRGMQVSGSAESIGKLTTTSVVQSIFMVLLMDALFSIFFSKLGI